MLNPVEVGSVPNIRQEIKISLPRFTATTPRSSFSIKRAASEFKEKQIILNVKTVSRMNLTRTEEDVKLFIKIPLQ